MDIAKAYVEVRVRQDQVDRDLAQLRSKVEGSARGTASSFASIFGSIAVGAGIKKTIDAASELEQAVGGTAAVFGEARKEIDDFAATSATSAGLSQRAARELTAQLGGLLSGFGFTKKEAAGLSIELTKLGADLSATFGGKPEEAVQALGAAMRGETDPIERYGISLNQAAVNAKAVELGLADTTSSVDANAKAQATLAIITEKSAGAQGQFAREADSAAGKTAIAAAKTEDAAASMGDSLLPIYSKAVDVVSKVADAFGALPDGVQTGIIALAGVAAAAGPVSTAIGTIRDLSGSAAGGIRKIGDAAGSAVGNIGGVAGGLQRLTIAAGTVGAIIAVGEALDAAFNDDHTGNITEIENALVRLGGGAALDSLPVDLEKVRDAFERTLDPSLLEGANDGLERFTKSIPLIGEALSGSNAFEDAREAIDGFDQALASLATKDAASALAALNGFAEQYGLTVEDLVPLLDGYSTALAANDTASRLNAEATGASTEANTTNAKSTQEQIDKLGELQAVLLATFDSNLAYRNSVDSASDGIRELVELQKSGKATTEELDDATRDLEGKMLAQAAAAVKMAEDQAKANGTTLDAGEKNRIYREQLQNLADQLAPGSALRAQLQGYIDQLNAIPPSKSTTVTATYKELRLGTPVNQAAFEKYPILKNPTGKFLGGGFQAGDRLRVGDGGPEEIEFGQPGTVIPNRKIGGSGTTFNGPVTIISEATSARDVYDESLWRVAG